jgi:hypothetical protein
MPYTNSISNAQARQSNTPVDLTSNHAAKARLGLPKTGKSCSNAAALFEGRAARSSDRCEARLEHRRISSEQEQMGEIELESNSLAGLLEGPAPTSLECSIGGGTTFS